MPGVSHLLYRRPDRVTRQYRVRIDMIVMGCWRTGVRPVRVVLDRVQFDRVVILNPGRNDVRLCAVREQ